MGKSNRRFEIAKHLISEGTCANNAKVFSYDGAGVFHCRPELVLVYMARKHEIDVVGFLGLIAEMVPSKIKQKVRSANECQYAAATSDQYSIIFRRLSPLPRPPPLPLPLQLFPPLPLPQPLPPVLILGDSS